MSDLFILDVKTNPKEYHAKFTLSDSDSGYLGANEVKLLNDDASQWEGLFSLRDHVRNYAGFPDERSNFQVRSEEEIIQDLGVFLANSVLGRDIFDRLYEGIHNRALLVRLPDKPDDTLAAAFARVPWEIARPSLTHDPLYERNLAVRVITGEGTDESTNKRIALDLAPGEPLRVLLVFSEAEGSSPLALRLERERLFEVFFDDILPEHNVHVDVLCHGVTVENIAQQVKAAKGYHVVHWSGHGHHDLLEVYDAKKGRAVIQGEELVNIFRRAGGRFRSLCF